ncbi:transposase [Bifidobacterium scardovii]|uniref:transposase n=1 Tax=Bifidobacterium scardovii TaxID=158787 RepID=UPI00242AA464|nr:transposase [Bifidobacterium scardovii]MBS6948796.1 transposase [Bifidobacterium scardovii]
MPGPIVTLNEESPRPDLRELAGKTVEDTLNGLLEAEADELVGAGRAAAAAMPRAVHAMGSREASEAKALAVAEELEGMRLGEAARVVRAGYAETLTYTGFPREHWARIRIDNAIERLNREVRGRTRAVGTFPDGKSALMLAPARLEYVAESEWGSRRYLDVTLLEE